MTLPAMLCYRRAFKSEAGFGMKVLVRIAGGLSLVAMALPAAAQSTAGYEGEQFVQAVRKGDNDKALELLGKNPNVVNSRDYDGHTPLVSAVQNRDSGWTGELLRREADPNAADKTGETPLIAAARIGFMDAAEWLLSLGAAVDKDNRMGETPLIIAVQQRNLPMVKLLLDHGANPDKKDSAQGYSARDYAKRDNRSPELLRAIEAKKPSN
jgi:ankyrin repeat protein